MKKEEYYFSVEDIIGELTDSNIPKNTLDTKEILRLIESVPSPKAEPFKLWLAQMGKERIDEIFNPEIALSRAINYYRSRGYSYKWIEAKLKEILNRKELNK